MRIVYLDTYISNICLVIKLQMKDCYSPYYLQN